MATTREDLRLWLERGNATEHSHMIVATDTFDFDDYPVFVKRGKDVHEELKRLEGQAMTKVMEVYNFDLPLDPQVQAERAWNP